MTKPLPKPFGSKHLSSGGGIPRTTPEGRMRGAAKANKALKFKASKVELKDPWGRK